jgi:hypothetical protein
LICKHRGSEMKIISFIYERAVIKRILVHLHLYSEPKQQRAPPAPEPKKIIREYSRMMMVGQVARNHPWMSTRCEAWVRRGLC